MGRILVFLFPVTPYFVWKLIAGERAHELAATHAALHQAKMFATVLEWLGLQRLGHTDLVLLAMALFGVAGLFGVITARVFAGRSFGPFGNGTIGVSGAIATLAIYASHTRWIGGPDFVTALLLTFVGATMFLLMAVGLRIFLVSEATDLMSSPKKPAAVSSDRLKQVSRRR